MPPLVEMTLGLAVASAPQVELQWQAPASCPSQADVLRRLANTGVEQGPGGLQATAEIRRQGQRFHLVLHLRAGDREQSRELDDGDCSVLADAVALMISAHGSSEPPQQPSPPTPEPIAPTPAPQPPEAAAQVPKPTAQQRQAKKLDTRGPAIEARRPSRDPVRTRPAKRGARKRRTAKPRPHKVVLPTRGWSLGGHAGLSGGLWPTLQARADLVTTYTWHQWAFDFGVGADLPREATSDPGSGRSALVTMLTAPLRVAFQPGVGPVSFPITVGAEFGTLYVSGRGDLDRPESNWHWWGMAMAGFGVRAQVHERFSLLVRGETTVPWRRLELVAGSDRRPLMRLRPVGFRVVIGADIHFPQRKRRAS